MEQNENQKREVKGASYILAAMGIIMVTLGSWGSWSSLGTWVLLLVGALCVVLGVGAIIHPMVPKKGSSPHLTSEDKLFNKR